MPRVILYPRRDGGFYRHICKKPGPQAQPELRRRKRNLTLEPRAIKLGEQRANQEGLSFSRYVEFLIYADCRRIQSVQE